MSGCVVGILVVINCICGNWIIIQAESRFDLSFPKHIQHSWLFYGLFINISRQHNLYFVKIFDCHVDAGYLYNIIITVHIIQHLNVNIVFSSRYCLWILICVCFHVWCDQSLLFSRFIVLSCGVGAAHKNRLYLSSSNANAVNPK